VAEKNECESRLADDQREGDAEVYAKRQTLLGPRAWHGRFVLSRRICGSVVSTSNARLK
jgi:hypothetical protein